jgi:hypothetical protein
MQSDYFLLIEQVLTNSTVTTTVLQQASGASFLGLLLTDWITAFSSFAMVAITAALVYYARVTILEGKKDRQLDSYEKQLVNLFNPMAWFLHRAELFVQPPVVADSGEAYTPRYRKLLKTDVENLRKVFVEYGHYLEAAPFFWPRESIVRPHHSIESFLFFENRLDSSYLIFPDDERTAEMCRLDKYANWADIFATVAAAREILIAEWKKQLQ